MNSHLYLEVTGYTILLYFYPFAYKNIIDPALHECIVTSNADNRIISGYLPYFFDRQNTGPPL